ncbi:MAG: signal recognition particle-docking protein FtsY [Cuniculiplasma divulgatum]|jgi:fused signal recognition particle receptor|nr:MAG: signal recognition particle-docking protein FtsY [Cuniculiplasma divulgatum]
MFENFRKKLSGLFKGSAGSDEVLRKGDIESSVRDALLESDVSLETSERIIADLDNFLERPGKKVSQADLRDALRKSIRKILDENSTGIDILNPGKKPFVILFLGINGTGKTTTVAKIANYLKKNGKRVVVAAGDTFRAGAIEQLSLLCQDIGVNLIKHEAGSDPASVAFDAIDHAKARNLDYVLIDSAGRMQTNKNLLEEMKKMKRVAKPDLTVLVLDAMIGQDAVYQAETFMKETSFDCVVLTKLDTDARGGAIITIADQLRKPVLFLGVGQGMDDIMEFSTEWYLDRVLPN